MKKLSFIILTVVLMVLSTSFVYAGSHADEVVTYTLESGSMDKFKITSGISKKTEVTFDNNRTITGTAENGTELKITVSVMNADKELEIKKKYTQTVGQSGVFTQDIELFLGDNYITIYATQKTNKKTAEFEICRINAEVKEALEKSIVIPGQKRT